MFVDGENCIAIPMQYAGSVVRSETAPLPSFPPTHISEVLVLCIYSFFPTEICTLVDVPGSTRTILPMVSCGGERLVDRLRLSTTAALTYSGHVSCGCDWRALSDSGDSTEICTPASSACGTDRSASLPYTLIAGKPPTDFPLFHAASCKMPSNCLSSCIHSGGCPLIRRK